jgi:hypothetical protein
MGQPGQGDGIWSVVGTIPEHEIIIILINTLRRPLPTVTDDNIPGVLHDDVITDEP